MELSLNIPDELAERLNKILPAEQQNDFIIKSLKKAVTEKERIIKLERLDLEEMAEEIIRRKELKKQPFQPVKRILTEEEQEKARIAALEKNYMDTMYLLSAAYDEANNRPLEGST